MVVGRGGRCALPAAVRPCLCGRRSGSVIMIHQPLLISLRKGRPFRGCALGSPTNGGILPRLLEPGLSVFDGDPLYSEPWLQSVSLNRSIVKNGFHRELLIDVKLNEGAHRDCCIMIKEQLPQGLYVDPYELASLHEHSNAKVFVQKEIDIEAPAYLSPVHTVIIYLNPDPSNPGHFVGTVPVHIRYHRPTATEETNTLVILTHPHLMIHCQRDNPVQVRWNLSVSEDRCSVSNPSAYQWVNITYQNVVEILTLEVPVGQKKHALVVTAATLLSTVLCCSLLLRVVWMHGQFES
ncbi:phosphatidylinositol-glycan biosynthesis class X protein isoform X3 [Hypanus sabinus]|uniref:phosphatidylinositol-glycan biosynthesis class X protein isoform X3 n=1 Tax=Hypanus sabinus TaxID=79690 RepID=UPI0028C4C039|nr:phosphatidylinositol-glycan biosynthesis class X protein isoform X3 [Hypanus sabinus]